METGREIIEQLIQKQRAFFESHQTKQIDFRRNQLNKLADSIQLYEKRIEQALWEDLRKSPQEAYLTEISIVKSELNYHIKKLKKWSKPKRVPTPLHMLPSQSRILYEPLGVSLIIAPWNYPFQLLFNALVGSISSGCCTILKPSPDAPATAKVMQEIIEKTFDSAYVAVVQGGIETNTILLQNRFDIIFFTGSTHVGRIVSEAAAKHLTPVVLELGGKSPCIVDQDANLDLAAKRIVWGKLINAGQTCIAPDYVFVHEHIKKALLEKMVFHIQEMYGEDSLLSSFYPRIIHDRGIERLKALLQEGEVVFGGKIIAEQKFIEPTIIDHVQVNHAIMQEEIFGPLLPLLTYTNIEEPISYINKQEKPLALYFFGRNNRHVIIEKTSSGGVCVNDTLMHVANHHLPFGGVGASGMGAYHGRESFLVFSNKRALVSTPTWIDLPFKYVPFKLFSWIKKLI